MKGIDTYKETAITTQSKGRLIVMLYDGAIKFMKQAIIEIQNENWSEKGKFITKAQDIINELNNVLDMESGGEIATNLRSLYFYMNRKLNEANANKDPQILEEVIKLMEELNQSWKAIV